MSSDLIGLNEEDFEKACKELGFFDKITEFMKDTVGGIITKNIELEGIKKDLYYLYELELFDRDDLSRLDIKFFNEKSEEEIVNSIFHGIMKNATSFNIDNINNKLDSFYDFLIKMKGFDQHLFLISIIEKSNIGNNKIEYFIRSFIVKFPLKTKSVEYIFDYYIQNDLDEHMFLLLEKYINKTPKYLKQKIYKILRLEKSTLLLEFLVYFDIDKKEYLDIFEAGIQNIVYNNFELYIRRDKGDFLDTVYKLGLNKDEELELTKGIIDYLIKAGIFKYYESGTSKNILIKRQGILLRFHLSIFTFFLGNLKDICREPIIEHLITKTGFSFSEDDKYVDGDINTDDSLKGFNILLNIKSEEENLKRYEEKVQKSLEGGKLDMDLIMNCPNFKNTSIFINYLSQLGVLTKNNFIEIISNPNFLKLSELKKSTLEFIFEDVNLIKNYKDFENIFLKSDFISFLDVIDDDKLEYLLVDILKSDINRFKRFVLSVSKNSGYNFGAKHFNN